MDQFHESGCYNQTKKMRATVFLDWKGILLIEFLEPGTTITSEVYCDTLKKLLRSIKNKRHRMFTKGVPLFPFCTIMYAPYWGLHNSFICTVQMGGFKHPQYGSDLLFIDYDLFTKMKFWLLTHCFETYTKHMGGDSCWQCTLCCAVFNKEVYKLVATQYDKCLNKNEVMYLSNCAIISTGWGVKQAILKWVEMPL